MQRSHIMLAVMLAALTGCHTVYNWTGTHQSKAMKEAREFADAESLVDAEIECKKHDSDDDGDVTCTVHADSDRITLECPTRKFFRFAEDRGCKETIRLTGRVTK